MGFRERGGETLQDPKLKYLHELEQNKIGCTVTLAGLAPWIFGFWILEITQLLGLDSWDEDNLAPCLENSILKEKKVYF